MKTTLNQIQRVTPDQGKFLDLLSYQAKTTPDDVEFPVTDILNATNLKYALFVVEKLSYLTEQDNQFLNKELEFEKEVWNIWREKFSESEYKALKLVLMNQIYKLHKAVFRGLNLIEDRFERQETEKIIAAKFLQHFKS